MKESSGFPLDDLIDEATGTESAPQDDWEREQRKKDDAALRLKARYLAKEFSLDEDAVFKSLQAYAKTACLMSRGV